MKLIITDSFGKQVLLSPRVELYSVHDYMGKKMPGLAIVLDEIGGEGEQYAVLTVSFGEFIAIKNSAYIDTNNCPFAEQLLGQGIAVPTGLTKHSGYCVYPLWVFNEDFLKEIGGEKYRQYAEAYNRYFETLADSEDEDIDESAVQTEDDISQKGEMKL